MTRLLILSSSGGAGHVRAGQALEAACREDWPGVEVVHHDALEFCGRPTRFAVADLYLKVVSRIPGFYGYFYERSDREMSRRTQSVVRTYDRLAYRTLAKAVAEFAPDEILCTHFLPAHVMVAKRDAGKAADERAGSRRRARRAKDDGERIRGRLSVVLTDYDAHYFWIDPGLDRFFVGSPEVGQLLGARGIPADRTRVTGIPIHPVFTRSRGREAVARALGVEPDRPTVLLMSGGFGVGDVEATLERLLSVSDRVQFIVIAGRNEALKRKLERAAAGANGRVRVFGFVTNIEDHMEASDLAVTKAGGLTVTECIARGLPMVIFNPIPGQEEMNADWLAENGAAVKVKHPDLLAYKLGRLLEDPQRLGGMKRAARALSRPAAAFDILREILGPGKAAGRVGDVAKTTSR